MIPFLPGARREPRDDHLRARLMASDALEGPLPHDDLAWLERHQIACDECRTAAADYANQRALLRGQAAPEPPRDLWARTRAAIEADSGRPGRQRSLVPYGALAGALVVAVVVGTSVLSRPGLPPAEASPSPLPTTIAEPSPAGTPRPTPLAVAVGDVGWLKRLDDGTIAVAFASVDQVCRPEIRPDCPTLDAPSAEPLALTTLPRSIVAAPPGSNVAVVDATDSRSGGAVLVVTLGPAPSPGPSPEPSPPPSVAPSVAPSASPSPEPTTAPASLSPGPDPSPSPDPSPDPSPSPSPEPTTIAIAEGVISVGQAAGFSADGRWFAFSARPSDGSNGPDVYLWEQGTPAAVRLTSDHATVFAGWIGDRLLVSRVLLPGEDPEAPDPSEPTPVSLLIDPSTGSETVLPGDAIWRPVIDPTGTRVIFWQGTLVQAPNGTDWLADDGRLVMARLDPAWLAAAATGPESSPEPAASPEPGASLEPTLSPSPIVSDLVGLMDGPLVDWDVHWDDDGSHFGLWVADPVEPSIGLLSLHFVDADDRLDPYGPVLPESVSLPGFSIREGRLAFAVPAGQDGEGSRVVVVTWHDGQAFLVESMPGSDDEQVLVVR
ncbi:MAG TPA: hypothetical protein VLA23_08545 [Candidatus Limnocylindrales bacterium]|nr:hypothetical protein [Candidatus Limnocylindrales bacterium]